MQLAKNSRLIMMDVSGSIVKANAVG